MTKVLSGMLILFAMTTFTLAPVYAGGHTGGSKCTKCSSKQDKCKVTKLKKEMTLYWAHKDELKMSEEQLMQIANLKHAAMKQLVRENAEVKIIKIDVKTELWASQIDTAKVDPLIDAKYAAKAKLAKTYVKALADAQAILSDDQRAKMKQIKEDKYISESGVLKHCTGKYCPLAAKKS